MGQTGTSLGKYYTSQHCINFWVGFSLENIFISLRKGRMAMKKSGRK